MKQWINKAIIWWSQWIDGGNESMIQYANESIIQYTNESMSQWFDGIDELMASMNRWNQCVNKSMESMSQWFNESMCQRFDRVS